MVFKTFTSVQHLNSVTIYTGACMYVFPALCLVLEFYLVYLKEDAENF